MYTCAVWPQQGWGGGEIVPEGEDRAEGTAGPTGQQCLLCCYSKYSQPREPDYNYSYGSLGCNFKHRYSFCQNSVNTRRMGVNIRQWENNKVIKMRKTVFQAIMENIGVPFWEQPLSMWDTVNNVGLRYV